MTFDPIAECEQVADVAESHYQFVAALLAYINACPITETDRAALRIHERAEHVAAGLDGVAIVRILAATARADEERKS